MAAEDIAARFGVTPTAVKQHLKLGAVSPRLVQAYRDEELSLDELTAFATPTTMHDRNESGASYRTTTAAATPSFGRCLKAMFRPMTARGFRRSRSISGGRWCDSLGPIRRGRRRILR
jgi:ParB family transcriptional regulator, chromosome partitioning protein